MMNSVYFFVCMFGIIKINLTKENETRLFMKTDKECSDLGVSTKFYVGLQKPLRRHHCGGTLLNGRWVLSSAQCRTGTDGLFGVVGIESVLNADDWTEIDRIFVYPHWNEETNEHDIAMFRLTRSFVTNPVTEYVKLPDRALPTFQLENALCQDPYIMGITYKPDPYQEWKGDDPILCVTGLHIIPWEECIESYESVQANTLCSSSYHEDVDTCRGDLGGPLMCGDVQYGMITSQRCKGDKPMTFTRIDPYLGFIKGGMRRSAAHKKKLSGTIIVSSLAFCWSIIK